MRVGLEIQRSRVQFPAADALKLLSVKMYIFNFCDYMYINYLMQ